MTKDPDIQILMLANRESLLTNGVLSTESIIGVIMFSVHETIVTSINAIGIHKSYGYNSFDPFLIHLCNMIETYNVQTMINI